MKYAAFTSLVALLLLKQTLCFAEPALAVEYKPDGYAIHTIETPLKDRFHITGMDSDKNGVLYVATRVGDVWTFDGETWHKFAEGLHEPTGLLLDHDGTVIVAQKPELTRLIDTDGDNTADEYRFMAGDWEFHNNYHEYTFGPVKDAEGNYYGTLNLGHALRNGFSLGAMASKGGYRGFAFKVDKAGQFSPYAWGLRSPAGVGASPEGEIFFTDNQGDWVPTSKLHLLRENRFYGHPVSLIDIEGHDRASVTELAKDLEKLETMAEQPVVWIPHTEVASSPGNPEWDVTEGKFGPFAGQMFIGDQTQSNIFRVLLDKVNGEYQGAVLNFMNNFQSGNIRIEFDTKGQLWVGQTARGWEAQGGKPFGLQKVVWDGTNPFELLDIKLTKTGFEMAFTAELDAGSVSAESLRAQEWDYLYSSKYGSPKMNQKDIAVNDVTLRSNGKTIDVTLPLTAGKVVEIDFSGLKAKDGRSVSVHNVFYTLNQLKLD